MNKKILLFLLIIIGIICLTGCDSKNETVNILFDSLKKQKIVDNDLNLVDSVIDINAGIIPSRNTYYIYKNTEGDLLAINYDTDIFSKEKYSIKIYYDVSINKDIVIYDNQEEILNEERFFIYGNETYTIENKYNLMEEKQYIVHEKSFLFYTKYKFELIK